MLRFFPLLLVCAAPCLSAETAQKPAVRDEQPARYIRFPETISPDGEYVLAWGNSLTEGVDPKTLTEAPAAAWINPWVFEIQDYLVETKRVHAPLALPGFEYFSGARGHEYLRGLSVAWAADSSGLFAVYDSDAGYVSALWIDPVERRVTEVGKTIESKLRGLVIQRYGDQEAAASRHVFFARMAMLEPRLLTIDGTLSRANLRPDKPMSYWFRMRFSMVSEGKSTRAEMVTSRVVAGDDPTTEPIENNDALESRLEKTYETYRARLVLAGREALKKEQTAWLKQREALANPANRLGFTRHRLEELRIRAAEYEPPQAR